MTNKFIKTQRKTPKRNTSKISKSLWKRRKRKMEKDGERCQYITREEKGIKLQYHCECNKSLFEEEKRN